MIIRNAALILTMAFLFVGCATAPKSEERVGRVRVEMVLRRATTGPVLTGVSLGSSSEIYEMMIELLMDRQLNYFEDRSVFELMNTILYDGQDSFEQETADQEFAFREDSLSRALSDLTIFADELLANAIAERTASPPNFGGLLLTHNLSPTYVITHASFIDALKKLCPLWPICKEEA